VTSARAKWIWRSGGLLGALVVIAATLLTSVWTGLGIDPTFLTFALATLAGPAAVALGFAGWSPSAHLRSVLLGFAGMLVLLFGLGQWRNYVHFNSASQDLESAYAGPVPAPSQLIGSIGLTLTGLLLLFAMTRTSSRDQTRLGAMLFGVAGALLAALWRFLGPTLALGLIGGPE